VFNFLKSVDDYFYTYLKLKATISSLTAILKTEESIKAKVSEELSEIEKKYASPRRTRLVA
jgi:DNA gyrase/topoisomerase IV subunit A